jgi:dTDP-4-amino-4,6-dideoxygalactose transaminase
MVLARSAGQLARIRRLSLHGMTQDAWQRHAGLGFGEYDVVECGFKYNMMDLQAAIGLHQLRRLESSLARRRAIWERYQAAFADLPVTLPAPVPQHMRHAMHLYTLLLDAQWGPAQRASFLRGLADLGIGAGIHYKALPEHSYYQQRLGWRAGDTPVATAIGRRSVTLPLSPRLSDADVERIVTAVRTVLHGLAPR